MRGHDGSDHNNKGASWPTDLRFRATQQGNKETRYDGAVNTRLRCEAGGDGKGHSQRQSDQSHGDASHQIVRTLLQAVVAQTEDTLGQPLVSERKTHRGIISKLPVAGQ